MRLLLLHLLVASLPYTCLVLAVHWLRDAPSWIQNGRRQRLQRRRRLTTWSDPRTTSAKTITPIITAMDKSDADDLQPLRIVAFGTSKTWGAGLIHPERETYIALLSPTARNLGLRSTPADYPSLCLYSMIGDEMYDVIILEFSPFTAHQPDFERLVRRLRARFPFAIIIYLPIYMLLSDVTYQRKSLQKHLEKTITAQGRMQSPKDPAFATTIRNLVDSELRFPSDMYSMKVYHDIVASYGGHVIEFPTFHGDIKRFILENAVYYSNDQLPWDFVHPSVLGHQVIAKQIQQKLEELQVVHQPRLHGDNQQQQQQQQPQPQPNWAGGKDRCLSWFAGFNTTDTIPSFTNMEWINFQSSSDEKWALEVGRDGGTLQVACLFSNCHIYISYMATRPLRFYPRVLVSVINDKNDHPQQHPVLVDPYIAKFHLRKIILVGVVAQPGFVTLSVKPIPEDVNSPQRFRITGVITTPTTY